MKFMNLARFFPAVLSATGEVQTVDAGTIMEILSSITSVFSISNIVALIAGILGVSGTFVFLWWAIRKGAYTVFAAVQSGKFKIG